jgi:hypothetical protein
VDSRKATQDAPAPFATVWRNKYGDRINAARPMTLQELERVIRKVKPAAEKERLPLANLARFGDRWEMKPDKKTGEMKPSSLRWDENVLQVHGIEGDYDTLMIRDGKAITPVSLETAADYLRGLGLAGLLYTSSSHVPELPRWRVMVPLRTPLEGDAEQLRQQRWHWCGVLNGILGGVLSAESFVLSQSYFFGPVTGAHPPQIVRIDGLCLDEWAIAQESAPLPVGPAGKPKDGGAGAADYDVTTDADLLRVIGCDAELAAHLSLSGHAAMLSFTARKAMRGASADDITAVMFEAMGPKPPPMASNGRDRREIARELARSAVLKYGESRAKPANGQTDTGNGPVPLTGLAANDGYVADIELRAPPGLENLKLQDLNEFCQPSKESWAIRDILPAGAMGVTFGAPKGGKTFSTCDMLMHAAHGMEWHGHKVPRPLRVVFLAGEGRNGLKRRLHAWQQHHDTAQMTDGCFKILPAALSMPEHVDWLIELLRPVKPDVVVTDTLNAFFGTGDESSTKDMTVFVAAQRKLMQALNCATDIIHHTPLSDTTRGRGSGVLAGAADVIITCSKKDLSGSIVHFQVLPSRDVDPWEKPLALKLQKVETDWLDEDGQPQTTCIVERASDEEVSAAASAKPGKEGKEKWNPHLLDAILEVLRKQNKYGYGWSTTLLRAELGAVLPGPTDNARRATLDRYLKRLAEQGKATVRDGPKNIKLWEAAEPGASDSASTDGEAFRWANTLPQSCRQMAKTVHRCPSVYPNTGSAAQMLFSPSVQLSGRISLSARNCSIF